MDSIFENIIRLAGVRVVASNPIVKDVWLRAVQQVLTEAEIAQISMLFSTIRKQASASGSPTQDRVDCSTDLGQTHRKAYARLAPAFSRAARHFERGLATTVAHLAKQVGGPGDVSDITGPWTLLPVRPISCFPWLALDPENILFLGQKPAEEFAHLIHQTHLKIAAPEALPLLWETDLPTELTARAELARKQGSIPLADLPLGQHVWSVALKQIASSTAGAEEVTQFKAKAAPGAGFFSRRKARAWASKLFAQARSAFVPAFEEVATQGLDARPELAMELALIAETASQLELAHLVPISDRPAIAFEVSNLILKPPKGIRANDLARVLRVQNEGPTGKKGRSKQQTTSKPKRARPKQSGQTQKTGASKQRNQPSVDVAKANRAAKVAPIDARREKELIRKLQTSPGPSELKEIAEELGKIGGWKAIRQLTTARRITPRGSTLTNSARDAISQALASIQARGESPLETSSGRAQVAVRIRSGLQFMQGEAVVFNQASIDDMTVWLDVPADIIRGREVTEPALTALQQVMFGPDWPNFGWDNSRYWMLEHEVLPNASAKKDTQRFRLNDKGQFEAISDSPVSGSHC